MQRQTNNTKFGIFRLPIVVVITIFVVVIAIPIGIYLVEWIVDWVFAPQSYLKPGDENLQGRGVISDIIRNRGWLVWMLASFIGLFTGLILTLHGRIVHQGQWKTQQKTFSHERYEKSAAMLGNDLMTVRIAGCIGLANLAGDDEKMRDACSQLLDSYAKDPYLSQEEKEELGQKHEGDLDKYLSSTTKIREDIDKAINLRLELREKYSPSDEEQGEENAQ